MAKKRIYVPKNKTNGEKKGDRKIWVENVKFLTTAEYHELQEAIRQYSRPELVNRNLLLISIALNNGLRASDVVTLRVGHVKNKTQTRIIEQKTGKAKTLYWNNCLAEIINYLNELDFKDDNDWLFPGRQDGHFSVHGFYQMLQRIARKTGTKNWWLSWGRTRFVRHLAVSCIKMASISKSSRSCSITPLNAIPAIILESSKRIWTRSSATSSLNNRSQDPLL